MNNNSSKSFYKHESTLRAVKEHRNLILYSLHGRITHTCLYAQIQGVASLVKTNKSNV